MNCKNCGGKLSAGENGFQCESCQSRFEFADFYENEEVYISYIETDDSGRRTKDSVIAQEIYRKLEGTKINTFFQRISAGNATDDLVQRISSIAEEKSKIVLIVATSAENFIKLWNKHQSSASTKTVLPVFSDMSASALPQEIKNTQALNYDAIGSDKDLIKNILQILGREGDKDLFENQKSLNKRKKKTAIMVLLIALIGILALSITCKPGVLNKFKSNSNEVIYEKAVKFDESKDYVQAIKSFCSIPGYKDSDTMLMDIYKLYNGVYTDENTNLTVRLDISSIYSANVKIITDLNKSSMSVLNENAGINENLIHSSYTDTNGVSGNFEIVLENDGIQVVLNNVDVFIPFENKTEKDLDLEINHEQILTWLDGKTAVNKLVALGYDIEIQDQNTYSIKNTDISIVGNSEGIESITGPADIICPEYAGREATPYYTDEYLYYPSESLYWNKPDTIGTIASDSTVTVASKLSLGVDRWDQEINTIKDSLRKDEDDNGSDSDFVFLPIGDLKFRMTAREVQRILGDPEKKSEELGQGATGTPLQNWEYPSLGISLSFVRNQNEQTVSIIRITAPCSFTTPQGIKIGSSRSEVINAYKGKIEFEETAQSADTIIVGSVYGGTIFTIDGDTVSQIFVGAGAE